MLVELDSLSFSRDHASQIVAIILKVDLRNALEHLWEVAHDVLDLLRVTNDLEKIFISNKVESGEVRSLLLKVLTEGLLNVFKGVGEALQILLKVGDLHDFGHDWVLGDNLHQSCEVVVNILELGEFVGQH